MSENTDVEIMDGLARENAALRAALQAAQGKVATVTKWANCGGNPFVLDGAHQICQSDPMDPHRIYGCAHGDRENGFACELHSFREMIDKAQAELAAERERLEVAERERDEARNQAQAEAWRADAAESKAAESDRRKPYISVIEAKLIAAYLLISKLWENMDALVKLTMFNDDDMAIIDGVAMKQAPPVERQTEWEWSVFEGGFAVLVTSRESDCDSYIKNLPMRELSKRWRIPAGQWTDSPVDKETK